MSVSRGGGRKATQASQSVAGSASGKLASAASRVPGPAGLFSSARHGLQGNPLDRFQRTRCQSCTGESRGRCRKPWRQVRVWWVELLGERLSASGKPELRMPSSGVFAEISVHGGCGWKRESFLGVGFASSCARKGRLCGLPFLRVAQSRG